MSHSFSSLITLINSISVCKTIKEALSHHVWHGEMIEELTALDENHSWELVNFT